MSEYPHLARRREERARREATRRRTRRRRWLASLLVVCALVGGVVASGVAEWDVVSAPRAGGPPAAPPPAALDDPAGSSATPEAPLADPGTAVSPLAPRLDQPSVLDVRFKKQPRAALLFDVDTGQVLWRRNATRVLPIASLTKIMTALLVAEAVPASERVLVSKAATQVPGSRIGLLKPGKRVRADSLLHGLMLASGNDAARALAEAAAGTQRRFVARMNRRAQELGLTCTRFAGPSGIVDRGNHSCARDLTVLSRQLLRVPRLARIVRKKTAAVAFPVKGGTGYLTNTNPLLRSGYKGTTGLKTGYTQPAGRCLVATARRGTRRLGVVLLDSPDPAAQAKQLLTRGFAADAR